MSALFDLIRLGTRAFYHSGLGACPEGRFDISPFRLLVIRHIRVPTQLRIIL